MSSKIALVTGAGRGIGAAICRRLAMAGYDIWANYKSNHDSAEALKAEVEKLGRKCTLVCFDVSVEQDVKCKLEPLLADAVPDILVNNAGFHKDALMMWMQQEEWQSVIDVNLLGFFLVTRAVLFGMLKRRSGRIINIASVSGQMGNRGQVNYSASKAGLIGATKALALEVCKKNVIVNCVSPGLIETEMTAGLPMKDILLSIPAGRLGTADEVAAVVEFLCSENAAYIIGQVISINGGLYV
jgi:3-oxoacyl-[acyl-carrier protein] reductase